MKKENLKKYGLVILVMLFVGASSMQAQQFKRGERSQGQQELRGPQVGEFDRKGPRGPHIPNLTEEQREQMKAFKIEFEKAALPLRNQIGEKEARLHSLVTAESYDERATNKVVEEIGDLKTDLMKLEIGQKQRVKSILTDEQVLALNHKAMKGSKGGVRRGPGNGPHHGRGR